jgi:hypothetical protein
MGVTTKNPNLRSLRKTPFIKNKIRISSRATSCRRKWTWVTHRESKRTVLRGPRLLTSDSSMELAATYEAGTVAGRPREDHATTAAGMGLPRA